jgi:hypothetical protein
MLRSELGVPAEISVALTPGKPQATTRAETESSDTFSLVVEIVVGCAAAIYDRPSASPHFGNGTTLTFLLFCKCGAGKVCGGDPSPQQSTCNLHFNKMSSTTKSDTRLTFIKDRNRIQI